MARTLRRTVVSGGVTYPAGTAATAELSKAISNPRAWDGEAESEKSGAEEPPRSGRGSGEDAWRTYATGLGIDVPEDAGRDDIVALVDAHSGK